jgi:hypothetical protein
MKPYIKNFRIPRIPYRRPYSAADPIKNYILLLLILLLLSAFVMGSCSGNGNVDAGSSLPTDGRATWTYPHGSLQTAEATNHDDQQAQYGSSHP